MKHRILALLLALVLILSALPMTAMAAEQCPHCGSYSHIDCKTHVYSYQINRDGHFYRCHCGARKDFTPHIKPEDSTDGTCPCGHKFCTNADLTVLWLQGVKLSPKFDSDKTEYEGKLVTYKDVTKTKISAKAFDAKATIELPEDLTIKQGTNKFEITVTAEDTKTTKTYTVTIVKD